MTSILDENLQVISVSELNLNARNILESKFHNVAISGEISNFNHHSSGHMYFSLKDDDASIGCAMWKGVNARLNFAPKNGDKCIVMGKVSLFTKRGDYQLIANRIQLSGVGDLYRQFEELKKKLSLEGLFEKTQKASLPELPQHIAVITSLTTAALQDILTTIRRRARNITVTVSPALVQGDQAPISIINALDNVLAYNKENDEMPIECILLCRGGGSYEDLSCFNDELLARKIFECPIPIISGVGHEIDWTIGDYVADLRAATPTAAAELITQSHYDLENRLQKYIETLKQNIENIFNIKSQEFDYLQSNLKHPQAALKEQATKLDFLGEQLKMQLVNIIKSKTLRLTNKQSSLFINTPKHNIVNSKNHLKTLSSEMNQHMGNKIVKVKNQLALVASAIETVSPISVLDRGYSIVTDAQGKIVSDADQLKNKDKITTRFAKNSVTSIVKKT